MKTALIISNAQGDGQQVHHYNLTKDDIWQVWQSMFSNTTMETLKGSWMLLEI